MFCKFLLDASSFILGALLQLATPWLWAYHYHHQQHHNHHHNISTYVGCSLLIENHYFRFEGKTGIILDHFCSLENKVHPWNFHLVLKKDFILLVLTGSMIFPYSNCHFYSKLTGCATYTSTRLSSLSLYTDGVHGST